MIHLIRSPVKNYKLTSRRSVNKDRTMNAPSLDNVIEAINRRKMNQWKINEI